MRKEYVNTKLEYEGEYFHGIKWNGKGYNINGKIIYELINGTGPVKVFKNNILIFEGSYVKGKKNGYAKVYYDTGEYKNNKKNGKGKRYDKKKGLIYDGDYLKGKKWNGVYKPHDKMYIEIYIEGIGFKHQ